MTTLLEIQNLTVDYFHDKKPISAVRQVSFNLEAGETLGIVGESGCGKSTLALSLAGLLPSRESRVSTGSIFLDGKNVLSFSAKEWRQVRGKKIAMIFQDPFSSLNPVLTIEYQLQESIALEQGGPDHLKALELMNKVQLPDPERILKSYPHQLSGGQRQRVLIAMALSRNPELLIADEPTTALDVTVQDEIVKLLKSLQKEFRMAMIFVTHNMGLVKDVSDKLAVMYAGQFIEYGKTDQVLKNPQHPYTQGLLRSLPSIKPHIGPIPVLEGQPPEPRFIPSGCPFHPRCEKILDICPKEDPRERVSAERNVRCHLY